MKNEASCPSEDTRKRIQNLVAAKSAQVWGKMETAIMQGDLHSAQLYTVADNTLNELAIANEMDIERAVFEIKASIRANMLKEDANVFQLQKQFTALTAVIELLQAVHNGSESTVWEQQENAYALAK